MYKEEKIAGFQQGKNRLQLLKITTIPDDKDPEIMYWMVSIRFQVRLNRKIIETSISEYTMRKLFAKYAQNIILQLKNY